MHHRFDILIVALLAFFEIRKADSITTAAWPSDERLVPIGSTTAFTCEPRFNFSSTATWQKDGKVIGNASSHTNLIYLNRTRPNKEENMPDIGFLIIYNVTKEDEGKYWCEDGKNSRKSHSYHLKVAYVDQIANNTNIEIDPPKPILGRRFIAKCPPTNSFPPAKISWTVNSLPISHISSDFTASSNGTLTIAHFSYHHFGFFECHVSNFAGKTSSQIFIDSRDLISSTPSESYFMCSGCSSILKNSIMMFFIGVFVTCAGFFIYMAIVILTIKPDRCSRRRHPYHRAAPRRDRFIAPGFRKPIAPMPDYLRYDRRPNI